MDPRRFDTFTRSQSGRPNCTWYGCSIDLICCRDNPGVFNRPDLRAAPAPCGNGCASGAPQTTPVG